MMTRCCIGRANLGAVPKSRPARSRAAFMKMPAMLPVRSPAQRPSNNPVAIENVSRFCLPILSASSGSAVSGCAGRAVRKRVHACCDRSEPTPSRQVRCPTTATTHGVRCVSGACVSADASTPKRIASASANQRPRNGLAGQPRPAVHRLLQQNLPEADVSKCSMLACDGSPGNVVHQL
jgi:hypothetical protein